MSLSDLLAKTIAAPEKVIIKINPDKEKTKPHEKRPGFFVVSGWLESGDETFIVLSDAETKAIPTKDGYADLSSVARIRTNKIGKKYIERLNPLEKLSGAGDFKSPF